jgi:hypothetical protein
MLKPLPPSLFLPQALTKKGKRAASVQEHVVHDRDDDNKKEKSTTPSMSANHLYSTSRSSKPKLYRNLRSMPTVQEDGDKPATNYETSNCWRICNTIWSPLSQGFCGR